MPLFFVDENVLNNKLQCVVCPVKIARMYMFEDISKIIYKKAGMFKLDFEFMRKNPGSYAIPIITTGFDLSDKIIHILVPDLINCKNFEMDIYNSYNELFKTIYENEFKSVVFPYLPFSYKSLGNMNSYRTCITLIRHFMRYYNVDSTNIYVLVDKRTMDNHINNYTSSYISSSFPLSKRHKPINYPLNTNEKLKAILKEHKDAKKYLEIKNVAHYHAELYNLNYKLFFTRVRTNCKNDADFCVRSNISKEHYLQILSGEYFPTKEELLGACFALCLNVYDARELLAEFKMTLNQKDPYDKIVINELLHENYDVYAVNEIMYLKNHKQLGTFVEPTVF